MTKCLRPIPLNIFWHLIRPNPALVNHSPAYYALLVQQKSAIFLFFLFLVRLPLLAFMPLAIFIWALHWRRQKAAGLIGLIKRQFWCDYLTHLKNAVLYGILPSEYYYYDLESGDYSPALYTRKYETKGMHLLLNSGSGQDIQKLKNKERFTSVCSEAGIAAASISFVLDHSPLPETLPKSSLFIKPREGISGQNTHCFEYSNELYKNKKDGTEYNEAAFREELTQLGTNRPYLIQPLLTNCEALKILSPGGLATVRVVTARTTDGTYQITDAVLRMSGSPENITDNFNGGNIAAPIDPETGLLGAGVYNNRVGSLKDDVATHHPYTKAPIKGTCIPEWKQVQAFCLHAHEAGFSEFVHIGWDVAITETGIMMIEGNWNPGFAMLQRLSGTPLGASALGAVLNDHFKEHLKAGTPLNGVV
ncbi:sugar-transfer associated ATP-grasp domain-containing protein [Kordiimonas pumila]|uniref:Sugar-transfer associated ATP-grasp domain-containing protein n=1 Tax=Kordiimonas pumila TaxID=2161677 RepID=A0ABV7D155_9PROT|nr:sugar-transfer associated ATP-grasp domain-containing protein [Kordiimonas pumila]